MSIHFNIFIVVSISAACLNSYSFNMQGQSHEKINFNKNNKNQVDKDNKTRENKTQYKTILVYNKANPNFSKSDYNMRLCKTKLDIKKNLNVIGGWCVFEECTITIGNNIILTKGKLKFVNCDILLGNEFIRTTKCDMTCCRVTSKHSWLEHNENKTDLLIAGYIRKFTDTNFEPKLVGIIIKIMPVIISDSELSL